MAGDLLRQRILFWDVETAPVLAYVWRAKTDWVPSGAMEHEVFMLSWAAKWEGARRVLSARLTPEEARQQDDSRIVQELIDLIRQADVVVAHNGDRFDVPMLAGRALLSGTEPLGPVRTIDTLKLARRSFKLTHNSLDHLARAVDVPTKLGTSFSLWRDAYHGDEKALAKMDRYCKQDVRVLEDVFHRLEPHVTKLPRLVDADHPGQHVCPSCGSEDLERRGYYHTNASTFQRWRCKGCTRWSRSVAREPDTLGVRPL